MGWGSNSFGESMAVAGWTGYRMGGDEETFSPNRGTAARSLTLLLQASLLPPFPSPQHILHSFWLSSLVFVWQFLNVSQVYFVSLNYTF